jgi:hypothetical protein
MSVGRALKAALRDLYENSWRLLVVNSAVSAVAIAAAVAASYAQPALLLLVLVGPAVAALMHCAVKLQQTDEVCMRDAVDGLRLHWRRGLVLWTLLAATLALAVLAIWFYARRGAATWPLAVAAFYVFALFAVWQLHVWPLAIAERGRSLRDVFGEAARGLARRPLASIALAFWLLLVNVVGAAGILPFLTLTVAYSFLAAAHFVLPPAPPVEEEGAT